MHKTIRFRIALLISSLMLIVLIGFGVFIYVSLSTQLLKSLDAGLRLSAGQLLPTLENEDGDLVFGRGDVLAVGAVEQDDLLRLLTVTGEILDVRGQIDDVPIPPASITDDGGFYTTAYADPQAEEGQEQTREEGWQDHQDSMRLYSAPVIADGQIIAYLQIGRSLESIQDTLGRLLTLLLIAGPALLGVTSVSGYWLAGRSLAPIEDIRRQAAAISAEDLSQRLATGLPDDEVGRLAQTFDQMLARLNESFQRQRRFTADASHELRTPLAIIRGEVDVALDRPRSPEDYVVILRSVGVEAERMSRLASHLLQLSRGDTGEMVIERERIDLTNFLRVLLDQMKPQADAANVILQADLPDQLIILGDVDRLLQLFLNLLDNAFAYAPNSTVWVRARTTQGAVEIEVADTGPGIHPEHLPHLFERFYRVDKARSRSSGGNGLGLSIAREIALAHGGEIAVHSAPGKGATFVVRLPSVLEAHASDQSAPPEMDDRA